MTHHDAGEDGLGTGAAGTAWARVDGHGRVTAWSEGAHRLLGHRPADVVGMPAARLLAERHHPPLLPEDLAVRERWNGRLTLRHRDGHDVDVNLIGHRGVPEAGDSDWLLLTPVPGDGASPDPAGLLADAFLQAPCAMAVFDDGLRLRRVNARMERVLRLTGDEMRGLRLSEIVGPAGTEAEDAMTMTLRTGTPQYLQLSLFTADRTRRSRWSVSFSPLRDRPGGGGVNGVVLSAHDQTSGFRAHQRLRLVNEAGARIGSTLDITLTAQELAEVAVPGLADFVTVDLLPAVLDGGEPPPGGLSGPVPLSRVAHRSVLEGVPEAAVELGEVAGYPPLSPAAESLSDGRAVVRKMSAPTISAWAGLAPRRAARIREFGMHSVMAVPIRARGITLGVAKFIRHRHPEPFAQHDLLLAEEMTARAGVSIDNARRYTRERNTSLALQRSLLPRQLPEQAAVEVASRYLPAGVEEGVGGDWFDVVPLSGARVALVVGDVVGHGVQASATMGRLRTAVRTLADVDLPPDELLTHLDDLVARLAAEAAAEAGPDAEPPAGTVGETGASCLYAVYDPVSRVCTMARAGHLPPVLVLPDGSSRLLEPPVGPPLGTGGLPFESAEYPLPEGSLLALYTDGLVEAGGRDREAETARLAEILRRPSLSLENTGDAVLSSLLPVRPEDDVALLLARTRALDASQVATWELRADPAVVSEARKLVTGQLSSWGLDETGFVAELVASELVTNAIRHARAPIRLRLINDRRLICEVSDSSSTAPHLRRARTYDEGGRGLLLVAQLSRAWGTRHTADGKTIWAEMDTGQN
ncbi:SpoIIE family protein phosphatase [Streptomyces sodiiphilus]|uniref:SpoIIE family protein phosphatase n=1 Tax=Streptomyces sodiiphilus TaxID=226217 RepID=A0ABN2NSA9_9ACTN